MAERITCPGCGTEDRSFVVDRLDRYTVVQCTACTLQFADPMANPGGSWYDRAYVLRHSAIDTRVRDYYVWAVRALPGKGTLLDIGCGEGVFVNYARRHGFDAYGIDFSSEAIATGKRWFGLETIFTSSLADFKQAHPDRAYDAVTFFEVLEHLERPADFLAEASTVLKDGGHVAASVPNNDRWPYRDFGDYPPNHLTRWNIRSLRIFLVRNGFRTVTIRLSSRLGSYHNFLGYLVRTFVYSLFGMHAKGFNIEKTGRGQRFLSVSSIKRLFSFLRPRQVKDAVLWPIAVATFPFVFPWFRGSNIMFVAGKAGGQGEQAAGTADRPGLFRIDRSLNYGRHHIRAFLCSLKLCDSILDIGAGTGFDLLMARECHPHARLHAIDCHEENTQSLAGLGITVQCIDIEKQRLPFPDGSVDVVIANQILEHVKELFWIWHEISRVLPVGGSVIIGVPNLAALHNRILLAAGKHPSPLKNNSAHVRGFTRHDLLRFLESCFPQGYRLRAFAGSNFYPFPPLLARPLAALLPDMAWGIFFLFEKTRVYHDEFLTFPVSEGLETNFYTGRP